MLSKYLNFQIILLSLLAILVILVIYTIFTNYHKNDMNFEPFAIDIGTSNGININNNNNNNTLQLDANDIHFIQDNTPDFVNASILNYKIKTRNTNNKALTTEKHLYLSIMEHKPATINFTQYRPMGQYLVISETPIDEISTIKKNVDKKILSYLTSSNILTKQYNLIWTSDFNSDQQIISIWRPLPPEGATAMGDIIVLGTEPPNREVPCIPTTMLEQFPVSSGLLFHSVNDIGRDCYCWGCSNLETFRASNIYDKNMPDLQNIYNIPKQYLNNNTISPEGYSNSIAGTASIASASKGITI